MWCGSSCQPIVTGSSSRTRKSGKTLPRSGCRRRWRSGICTSEPWIFVVDGQGIIRAKFEGLTTAREIAVALQQILDPH